MYYVYFVTTYNTYVCMYRLMWKNLITPANDFKSDSSPVSPELFNQKQLVEEFWKYPPQHLEETGLESNSKLFLGIGILLDWLQTTVNYSIFTFSSTSGTFSASEIGFFFIRLYLKERIFQLILSWVMHFFSCRKVFHPKKSTKRLTHVCTRYNCRFPAWHYDRPFLWMIINHGPNCVQPVILRSQFSNMPILPHFIWH